MKKLNAFQLKIFMALLMVLDHLQYIPGLVPFELVGIFHAVTRCVGVWFAYMAVEGFIHTSNRLKYNARLFIWAAIMFGGNALLNYLYQSKEVGVHNNVFFTIALGVFLLNILHYEVKGIEGLDQRKATILRTLRIVLAIAVGISAYFFLGAEGALPMIPFMVICYAWRNNHKARNIALVLLAIPLIVISYSPYDTLYDTISMMLYNCEGLFITVLPFMYLYNGERGLNNRFSKYFFYVFYPAHLWIITTIAYFVK